MCARKKRKGMEMSDPAEQSGAEIQDKPVFLIGLLLGVGASVILAGFFVLGLFTGKYLAERDVKNLECSTMQVLRVEHG